MSSKRPPVFLFYDVMKNSLSTIFDATFLQAKPQDGIFHEKLKSELDTFIDLLVFFFFSDCALVKVLHPAGYGILLT